MDNRPKAHYARDVREAVGQIVGPNQFGERLVVDEVLWDGERSTAYFRHLTNDDIQRQYDEAHR